MKKIHVSVYPHTKTIQAYDYGPTVILIYPTLVANSDETIVTNKEGFRFKRKITGEANPLFYQFHKI